jgi:hypothetical protein
MKALDRKLFILLGGLLGEGADGTRREFHLHAIDMLGLHIHLESASRRDIGVAALVPDGGSMTGQFTGSAHTIYGKRIA